MILILVGMAWGACSAAQASAGDWERVADMPTARESVAACAVGGQLFAIGGFPGGSDSGLPTNERYDPQTDTWSQRSPMPTGRRMPAAVAVDGKCFLLGGRRIDAPQAMAVVEAYDPVADRWETLTPMPVARYAHSAVAVDGIIYIFGGTDSGNAITRIDAYDTRSDTWSMAGTMPSPRALAGAALLDGRVFLAGGTVNAVTGLPSLDIWDPVSGAWSSGASLPTPRFSLSAAVVDGRLYAIGGTDGPGALETVEVYDPGLDAWTTASPMITRRVRFATAVVGGSIYALGGATSFGVPHVGMELVERYTPLAVPGSVTINAGMNDAWYNRSTAGQGFLVSVFPVSQQMFVAWFTFDTERPAAGIDAELGDPGHRWLTAQGPYSGDTATLTIFLTEGGVFDDVDPPAFNDGIGDGTMTIEFADCSEALVTYQIFSPDVSGEIPIQRITDDNVALCEALADP